MGRGAPRPTIRNSRELAALPTRRPPIRGGDEDEWKARNVDWAELVALLVHPLKVAIIEALLWVGQPLSATELTELLADAHYSREVIGYHTAALARLGVIEETDVRRVRGAREKYFFFSG